MNSKLKHPAWHIHTFSIGDIRLIYNFAEIEKHFERELMKIDKDGLIDSLDAIVVTESYTSDIIYLKSILKWIKDLVGFLPTKSIIVLGTKKNDCHPRKAIHRE